MILSIFIAGNLTRPRNLNPIYLKNHKLAFKELQLLKS